MAWPTQDRQYAFNRTDSVEEVYFEEMWPTETAGNGQVVPNNVRDGGGQGKPSPLRKAHCRQCGFPLDLNANDHSGGAEQILSGAGGQITTATATITYPNGTTHTEPYGTQVYNKGAGCPLCFSKNSSRIRVDVNNVNPWNVLPPLGF